MAVECALTWSTPTFHIRITINYFPSSCLAVQKIIKELLFEVWIGFKGDKSEAGELLEPGLAVKSMGIRRWVLLPEGLTMKEAISIKGDEGS